MKWFEDFKPLKERNLLLPEEFNIRRAVPADAQGLALVRQEREGKDMDELLDDVKKVINESLNIETTFMFTALDGDKPIGYSIMRYFIPLEDAPANTAPEGWYLLGIALFEKYRRRGIGSELIKVRLQHIPEAFDTVYYFTNPKNLVSMALHSRFGFEKITEDIVFPNRKPTTVYFKADLNMLRKSSFTGLYLNQPSQEGTF
jgi:ribosomal protein S18 acetylase RimI-like enzyme